MNSQLLWWYLVNTGTVLANGYYRYKPDYIKPFRLPILEDISITKPFEILVDYVLFLKETKSPQVSTHVPNSHVANLFEQVIDSCVFELYFKEHMIDRKINVLTMVSKMIPNISKMTPEKKATTIFETYNLIRKSDVNTRIRSFIIKSPEILKPIIQI